MSEQHETAWVIERYWHSELQYFTGDVFQVRDVNTTGAFDRDHLKAMRFARAEDAALVLSRWLDGLGRVAEHIWLPKPDPAHEQK